MTVWQGLRRRLPELSLALVSLLISGGLVYLFYLHVLKEEEAKYAEDEAYTMCLVNRNAKRISSHDGGLAIVLDPFTIFANYPGQQTDHFTIDEHGFRGGIADRDKPKVAILGGSAAFGYGLDGDHEVMTSVLNRKMPSYTFLNAAVIGFVSGQESAQMIHHLDRLRPEVYVLVDGWNEVAEQFEQRNDLGVNRNFLFLGYQLHHYNVLTDESGLAEERYPVESLLPQSTTLEQISATYLGNLEKMNTWAKARGARLLVLLQPELSRREHPTEEEQEIGGHPVFSPTYRTFVDRALRDCREHGIECFDASAQPEFQESPETLFLDVVHPSPAGHEVLAEIISRLL